MLNKKKIQAIQKTETQEWEEEYNAGLYLQIQKATLDQSANIK